MTAAGAVLLVAPRVVARDIAVQIVAAVLWGAYLIRSEDVRRYLAGR